MAPAKKAAKKTAARVAKKATKKATKKPAKKTARKAARKTAASRAAAQPPVNVLVVSRVKEASKTAGASQVAGDFADALNERVHQLIADAVRRAQSNGRATVRPDDL